MGDEDESKDEDESDVILVSEGECVCERVLRVCVLSHDSFFTEFEKIKPRFEII